MTLFGKIIAGLLIIGGISTAVYFIQPSDTLLQEEEVVVTEETSSSTPPASGKKMVFSQFLKSDSGSYMCEVNQYVGDTQTKGTVYLDNGKVRGEFAVSVAGQNSSVTTIIRDGYTYSWSSLAPTAGFKVKNATEVGMTTPLQATGTQATYQASFDTIGDYSCTAQVIEESKFTIPASVTFTEINK